MVRYSQLFKNFPQFVVIRTVKGFSVVNEAEVDFFFLAPSLVIATGHPGANPLPRSLEVFQ